LTEIAATEGGLLNETGWSVHDMDNKTAEKEQETVETEKE
jgi:hypothetical protein